MNMLKSVYKNFSSLLSRKNIYLIKGLSYLGREPKIPLNNLDYVRVATLELLRDEIMTHNVAGDVAELGVYKGGFAKYINKIFNDRRLFLFDTFEGFDERDIQREKELREGYKHQDFTGTSADDVLKQMSFPGQCVIRKGYFPETFNGLEELKFSFVSIDADLYEPIRSGLQIFYERLSPQGFIMVHDYNNHHYPGCRQAVNEFCSRHAAAFFPIPDIGGSVVIRKV
jgi:O-methyltransferase